MTTHAIVSREKWLDARRDLLGAEKDLTRRGDQVAELRRKLPWVRVEKPYVFEGLNGKVSLSDLFDGRNQFLVQHFMLAPGWTQGCTNCSYMADHTDGMTIHLEHRDVTVVAISRGPYSEHRALPPTHGWRFNWVSDGEQFQLRFRCELHAGREATGELDYNFGDRPFVAKNCRASACSRRTTPARSSTPIRPTAAASK